MIQLIADDIDPNSTCQALNLCSAQKSEKKKEIERRYEMLPSGGHSSSAFSLL